MFQGLVGFIGPVGEAGLAGEKVRKVSFLSINLFELLLQGRFEEWMLCLSDFFREIEGRWVFPDHPEKTDQR